MCRWNRLENLLVQGSKDREFSAKDALRPILTLLLDPDGEELRVLVVKEVVCVTEAIAFGTMIDAYQSMPDFMKAFISNGNASGPLNFKLSEREQAQMVELRDRVFRIWNLLRSSENFDPSLLWPILQVLPYTMNGLLWFGFIITNFLFIYFTCTRFYKQKEVLLLTVVCNYSKCFVLQVLEDPEVRNLSSRVVGGITRRFAARLLLQVLRSPATATATAPV